MHHGSMRLLSLSLALLVGPTAALADEACHQRAVQLKQWMRTSYQESTEYFATSGSKLVKAPLPARRIERLEPLVWISPVQASVGGEPLGVVDGGRFEPASNRPPEQDPLRRALNFWCRMAMESPDFEGLCPGVVVSVGIEPGVPWSAVAAVLQRLASLEVRYVRFLFEGLATTSEPPRGAFYKEVEALHDIKRTQVGPVPARKKLFASCPLADDVEILLADEGPRLRRLLALAWPTAIERCGCKVNFDEVASVYWSHLGRYHNAPVGSALLELAPPTPPPPAPKPAPAERSITLEAPWNVTWEVVHAQALHASKVRKPVRIAVKVDATPPASKKP